MKTLKLRLVLLSVATLLTIGLSHKAAQAAGCADIIVGGNVYGSYECRLTVFCGGWCYYDCTCSDLFPGATCRQVLEEAGFEMSDGPPCTN
jgi:hypothetical protein